MEPLRVAQIIADTEAEGPGKRFAVWVQGCSLRCPGCCNPEMFVHGAGGTLVDPGELAHRALRTPDLEGISLLGGEPFEQAAGLADFAEACAAGGLSVMTYSGFTHEELCARAAKDDGAARLLKVTDLLVDGRYDRTKPDTTRRWIGSTNQVLHFLTARYSENDPRFASANTVELRLENGQLTINGWPAGAAAFRRR